MGHFVFEIRLSPERDYIRVDCCGLLNRESFVRMVSEARQVSMGEQLPILYDMRPMRLPADIRLSEVLAFVQNSANLNNPLARSLKSASLAVPEVLTDEVWDIYGYAAQNAGLQWAFFTEEQDALRWLCGDRQPVLISGPPIL